MSDEPRIEIKEPLSMRLEKAYCNSTFHFCVTKPLFHGGVFLLAVGMGVFISGIIGGLISFFVYLVEEHTKFKPLLDTLFPEYIVVIIALVFLTYMFGIAMMLYNDLFDVKLRIPEDNIRKMENIEKQIKELKYSIACCNTKLNKICLEKLDPKVVSEIQQELDEIKTD